MGLRSRRKGIRVEYLIRDHFRDLGYQADRVPSSGAAQGFKGDIKVSKDGQEFLVECKAKKRDFDTIYRFLYKNRDSLGTVRFTTDSDLVAMGSNFEDVKRSSDVYFPHADEIATSPADARTIKKIVNLKKLLGECQYLAIKRNHGVIVFLRFW